MRLSLLYFYFGILLTLQLSSARFKIRMAIGIELWYNPQTNTIFLLKKKIFLVKKFFFQFDIQLFNF